jgi:hypothetical protein
MRQARLLMLLLLAAARAAHSFTHDWDTVGSMLGMNPHAAGNGRYNDSPFAMTHWKWVAENYAVLVLGRFEDFGADGDPSVPGNYNCSCPMESSRVQVARILKKFNPKIRLLWYQNVVGDMTCQCCNKPLRSHPEWWVWDDYGAKTPFKSQKGYCLLSARRLLSAVCCDMMLHIFKMIILPRQARDNHRKS